jgi:hypothetical protein
VQCGENRVTAPMPLTMKTHRSILHSSPANAETYLKGQLHYEVGTLRGTHILCNISGTTPEHMLGCSAMRVDRKLST